MKTILEGLEGHINSDTLLDDLSDAFSKEITSYDYSIFGRPGDNKFVFLYDSSGLIGRLAFYKSENYPPSSLGPNNVIFINYRESDFNSIISFLRNEKSRIIIWIDGINSRISTGS